MRILFDGPAKASWQLGHVAGRFTIRAAKPGRSRPGGKARAAQRRNSSDCVSFRFPSSERLVAPPFREGRRVSQVARRRAVGGNAKRGQEVALVPWEGPGGCGAAAAEAASAGAPDLSDLVAALPPPRARG